MGEEGVYASVMGMRRLPHRHAQRRRDQTALKGIYLMTNLTLVKHIEGRIYRIRGRQVMLDRDLADLYSVPTKSLNLAARRNAIRFPEDFMFQLSSRETLDLRFQIETSSWGGSRYFPYAF